MSSSGTGTSGSADVEECKGGGAAFLDSDEGDEIHTQHIYAYQYIHKD